MSKRINTQVWIPCKHCDMLACASEFSHWCESFAKIISFNFSEKMFQSNKERSSRGNYQCRFGHHPLWAPHEHSWAFINAHAYSQLTHYHTHALIYAHACTHTHNKVAFIEHNKTKQKHKENTKIIRNKLWTHVCT